MPMFFTGRNPDHIAWPDFAHRTTLGLDPADAREDVQGLAERMRVPCRARSRVERHPVRGNPRRRLGCNDRILPNCAREIFRGSPAGRPRTREMDIHRVLLRWHALRMRIGYFFEPA